MLGREGATPRISGMFYKAVIQSSLLFGCETWTVTRPMLKALEGFHHRAAHRITGKVPRYLASQDRWVYPPIEDALNEVGLYPIAHYLEVSQNRLMDQIATKPILELCRMAERLSGSPQMKLWWDQFE